MSVNALNTLYQIMGRGKTLLASGAEDTSSYEQLLGQTITVKNYDPASTDIKKLRDSTSVTLMLCRNEGAAALLPKRVVTWKSGDYGKVVDGYARLPAVAIAGVVDEFLPSTGVAVNGIFWLVIEGQTLCKTDLAGDVGTNIAAGDILVSATGATSGATTAGRAKVADFSGTSQQADFTTPVQNFFNSFARALSANTTAQTDRDLLVHVYKLT